MSENLFVSEMLGNDPNIHLSGPRLEGYDSSSSTNCVGGLGQQRTKRMRTSFKHHQLRTMKSYFAINQNPGYYFISWELNLAFFWNLDMNF